MAALGHTGKAFIEWGACAITPEAPIEVRAIPGDDGSGQCTILKMSFLFQVRSGPVGYDAKMIPFTNEEIPCRHTQPHVYPIDSDGACRQYPGATEGCTLVHWAIRVVWDGSEWLRARVQVGRAAMHTHQGKHRGGARCTVHRFNT